MYSSGLFLICLVVFASARSAHQRGPVLVKTQQNSTAAKSSSSNRVSAKSARSDYPHHGFEHHYPHHYGYGNHHLGHFKDLDHYILPVLVILGLGILFMPLLSILMTTVVGNVPVTTLVSGRKKREALVKPVSDKTILKLWKKIGKAIEMFNN